MTWRNVQRDWPGFVWLAAREVPSLDFDEAVRTDADQAAFARHLARSADLTLAEAREIIFWRLIPAFRGMVQTIAAE